MSGCEALTGEASAGVAPALRAVDCLAGETVASAFGRLFGSSSAGGGGALMPALTIVLTLYIAFFAIGLLTGRSRIGISALTPRMLTLGLVLTFATSWVAYSQVVWNLATGAPDEIASVLTGSQGSATQIFGDRVDLVFAAIADAAEAGKPAQAAQAAQQGAQAAGQAATGNFTPANLMWLGALLLLLGTVGVLVTARIALAVLLAVGPIFVVFALFDGTRGLFVGWLRGLTLTAVTPLFVVVGGGVVLELLVPVVAGLQGVEGVNGRAALALFVIACVHVALMGMVLKVAGTMVAAWQVFGLAGRSEGRDLAPSAPAPVYAPAASPLVATAAGMVAGGRAAAMVPPASVEVVQGAGAGSGGLSNSTSRTLVTQVSGGTQSSLPPLPRSRARGIGSRFAAPQAQNRAGGLIR
jgi:type IV secretion system protein VirB6